MTRFYLIYDTFYLLYDTCFSDITTRTYFRVNVFDTRALRDPGTVAFLVHLVPWWKGCVSEDRASCSCGKTIRTLSNGLLRQMTTVTGSDQRSIDKPAAVAADSTTPEATLQRSVYNAMNLIPYIIITMLIKIL